MPMQPRTNAASARSARQLPDRWTTGPRAPRPVRLHPIKELRLHLENPERFDLARLGWDEAREGELAPHEGLVPGRVSDQQRGSYGVLVAAGEIRAEAAGRLHRDAVGQADLPAVGDWVVVDLDGGRPTIRAVLERRTALVRKAAGRGSSEQVLAANVDVVLVVDSLDGGPNRRRLERYLAAAWESGAEPIVVLTKADLTDDGPATAADVAASCFVRTYAVSAVTGERVPDVAALFEGDRTAAVVGPSGAGKSTLANRLLADERQATAAVRDDGRGRHTTTYRELFLLPEGGVVVDTPGLRELGLAGDGSGTGAAFPEVDELAAGCRFADCAHEREPGCAVQAALADGRLDPARLASWRKLAREVRFYAERKDARKRAERRKAMRRFERSRRRASEGPWRS